ELYLSLVLRALRQTEIASPDQHVSSITNLQKILTIDTARVVLDDPRGGHRFALLVGPTHPLRLLWLATWLSVSNQWVQEVQRVSREFLTSTRDSLLQMLSLVNFPAVFPEGSGKLLFAIDNLHPYWTIYASPSEVDPRGLMAEL